MRIGLIPLDERPVNTRYPAQIARIAGVELHLPPPELLSSFRRPAPVEELGDWLRDLAGQLDALIVSCEMLGYGGLIASRITDEPVGSVLNHLDLLRTLKRHHPDLMILGFNLITRVSNADNAIEEPAYWEHFGVRLYRLSQLLDRLAQGEAVAAELQALRNEIPAAHIQDFLHRRLRNHTANLAAIQLLADGTLDLLVLSSDDTSPYGLPSREKRWLAGWAAQLGLGGRLLMYPGADEVGCALLARLINTAHGVAPRFEVCYAVPGGDQVVAPYEDGPVRLTVERQVRAVGGILDHQAPDLWLAVNPPVERRGEWHAAYAGEERRSRLPHLQRVVEHIQQHQQLRPVVVADVAYPNGADPALIDLMRTQIDLTKLAAYGAWNTAGNTIGTALAQGCAARLIRTATQRMAQELFLLHRFVEDWGYQQIVRAQVRDWLEQTTGRREPLPATLPATSAWIEARLQALVAELPGFAGRYRIVPGSVRQPWGRTFEVDFDLEVMQAVEAGV